MSYRNLASMNIAVIGDGKVAEALAYHFALAEHHVFIGTKEEQTAIGDYIFEEFENVTLATIEYAASVADVIVMATPADEVREAAYLLDDVRKKIILDMSGFNYTYEGEELNTTKAIQAITYSQHVVKCYCDNYSNFANIFKSNKQSEFFVAGDSKKAKLVAKLFARDLQFAECYDLGSNDNIPSLDKTGVNRYAETTANKKAEEYAYVRK